MRTSGEQARIQRLVPNSQETDLVKENQSSRICQDIYCQTVAKVVLPLGGRSLVFAICVTSFHMSRKANKPDF